MTNYFNENESKMILLRSNNTDDETYLSIDTTKSEINSILTEIEFLNRKIDLLKRKIKRKSKKW